MHRERERIRAKGAGVAVIGNGAPRYVDGFREALGVEVPIYTDPSLRTYAALGFRRSAARTVLAPRSVAHLARALAGGFRQGRTQGDPWQLGGVVVVRTDGSVAYRYASAEAGDHAPVEAILAAL